MALRSNSLVRAVGLPLYRAVARARAGAPPRVLANGIPKSGTHLLTALLRELPDMRFSGEHVTAFDLHAANNRNARVEARLRRVRDGQFVSGHLPAEPELVAAVASLGYRSVFIVRDPRDVVVSDLFYILRHRPHPLHATLRAIPTDEERLAALISGLPDREPRSGLPLMPSIAERLVGFRGWLTAAETKVTKFEELVGERGGGEEGAQLEAVAAVAEHVGRTLDREQVRLVAGRIWSPESSTFRSGRIGDWRSVFTPDHVRLFKRVAGEQVVALGYEQDGNW